MPSKTWGTPQTIKNYLVVDENTEIPSGQKGYVFNRQTTEVAFVDKPDWQAFLAGNMEELKNSIESQIPHTRVVWVKASWTRAYPNPWDATEYAIEGFYAEAIVENLGGAALSGLEIVSIILAAAFLVAVVAICLTAAWVIWQVIESSGAATPIVGLLILAGLGIVLLLLFGVTFERKGKGFKVGKK